MNFKDALKSHGDFKFKLFQYINNENSIHLDGGDISTDGQCILGKWIYSEEKKFESLKSFEELKSAHAQFHKIAGNIVERVNNGEKLDPSVISSPQSEYMKTSNKIMILINELSREITGENL